MVPADGDDSSSSGSGIRTADSGFEKYFGRPNSKSAGYALTLIENVLFGPGRWFRANVLEPNRKESNYYHRRYRRVPTIDQCYMDDYVCRYEAMEQMKRDRKVEEQMVEILSRRYNDCVLYHGDTQTPDDMNPMCLALQKDYETARNNHYIKYGDLTWFAGPEAVLMKQKHRLVWERRHGENTMEGKMTRQNKEDLQS